MQIERTGDFTTCKTTETCIFDINEWRKKLQAKTTNLSLAIAGLNYGVSINVCSLIIDYLSGSLIEHIGDIVGKNVSKPAPMFTSNSSCFAQPIDQRM